MDYYHVMMAIVFAQVYVNNSAVRQLEANTFRGLKISNLQISHAQVLIFFFKLMLIII